MCCGKIRGLEVLSCNMIQSWADNNNFDLNSVFLLPGFSPSFTNFIKFGGLETFLPLISGNAAFSCLTMNSKVLSCLHVYRPCCRAARQPFNICFKLGFEYWQNVQAMSTELFPHLLKLSGVGKTLCGIYQELEKLLGKGINKCIPTYIGSNYSIKVKPISLYHIIIEIYQSLFFFIFFSVCYV